MKLMVSGHRYYKLVAYDIDFIKLAINQVIQEVKEKSYVIGLSGMASGVDLWFCQECIANAIEYIACPPFEEQCNLMRDENEKLLRGELIAKASQVQKIRNSRMVEMCDTGLIVWDGNKGGTHNVIQQLIENQKGFYWINPVCQKIEKCFLD